MRERSIDLDFERRLEVDYPVRRRSGVPNLAWSLVIVGLTGGAFLADRTRTPSPEAAMRALDIEISALRETVNELYAGQNGHDGLDEAALAGSNRLPTHMLIVGGLRNALGGRYLVSPAEDGGWALVVADIPSWACSRLAASDMGKDTVSVTVPSAAVEAVSLGTPMDTRTAKDACDADGLGNSVRWTFR